MLAILHYLSRRRGLTLLLIAIHLTVSMLTHGRMSDLTHVVRRKVTPGVFDTTVALIGIAVVLALGVSLLARRSARRDGPSAWVWGLATPLLMALAYKTLMSFSSESVHFVQYALLAVPVFALTWRFASTVLWVTLLGFVDELYQYFVGVSLYFDFNDVLLNLLGGGLGVFVIYLSTRHVEAGPAPRYSLREFVRSSGFVVSVALVALMVLASLVGLVDFYVEKGDGGAAIVFSRGMAPTTFWHGAESSERFHIVGPLEALLLAIPIVSLYLALDFKIDLRQGPGNGRFPS